VLTAIMNIINLYTVISVEEQMFSRVLLCYK